MKIHRNVTVTEALVLEQAPDVVVMATGSRPRTPSFDGADVAHVVEPWQVITGEASTGGSVLIADWACDWVGLGLAEKLAREGCHVRLCATGMVPGELIPQGVRTTGSVSCTSWGWRSCPTRVCSGRMKTVCICSM